MIDINELRFSASNSVRDLALLPSEALELIDHLEAAEKAVNEAYQRGHETGQEEVEKERDALRAELSKQQALTDAAQHIAEVAQSRANQLQTKITEMERQKPVAYMPSTTKLMLERGGSGVVWNYHSRCVADEPLYALPGADPAPSIPEGWQLVPTAESRHPGIYKMLGALHAADNTPGVSEWESYRAMLSEAPEAYQRGYATGQEEIEKERDALRAKITEMEQQAPFDADSDVFRSAFEAALKAGNWPATRQGDGYRSPSTQIAWRIAFSTVNRLKLCLAPGAQPAPSAPEFCPCCGNIMRACMMCPNEDCNAVTVTAEQAKYNKQHAVARKASGAAAPETKP